MCNIEYFEKLLGRLWFFILGLDKIEIFLGYFVWCGVG